MRRNPVIDVALALRDKRLLIFDFDGTVADTSPLHAAAFTKVLATFGVRVDYSCIAGLTTLDALRHCLDGTGRLVSDDELAALVTAKQTCVRQMIATSLKPLPGVDAFLRWARPRYRLAMVTSGSRGTVSLAIDKLGYTGWFDPLICAGDVDRAKPSPAGYLAALQMVGVPESDALVFEDSMAGFQAAMLAGIDYVDVLSTSWPVIVGSLP